ncbi:PREDICTED: BI1-like protein [Populus euphratica]|uniref:BI1-like protein n=1 Tax=Populus euphratica TaxID=75702 RepID=A0AAJ6UMC8_POPEU|nr:PREDICTED: BI1-like protein [Populus euphratica]
MWMNPRQRRNFDVGEYPAELDGPRYHWVFIRKVYTIIAIQLLVTVAVATAVVSVHSISNFIVHTKVGLAVYIAIIVIPFIVLCPLYYFYQLRPLNYLLLGVFTTALGFLVGLTCAFTSGKVILQSAIITFTAMVILTLYTFWAARRGHDFSFLGPFLSASLIALLVFALIQIFFPLGRISVMIFGCLASILFCGFIIYDTDSLIKRYAYDEYIWAAVSLYLDIINLFLSILTVCSAQDC